MSPSSSTDRLFERYYHGRPGFRDGTEEFHGLCRDALRSPASILEIGAGPPNPTSRFLATVAPVVGVDVSAEISANDALRCGAVFDGKTLPFADASFGGAVSNFVLEHVEEPELHFREVARVLRPGGAYIFRTPNLYHYVAAASRILPHWVHLKVANRLRRLAEEEHDPWRTYYRVNSRSAVRRYAGAAGFTIETLQMVEKEPSYGRAHPALFYPMMIYERVVNATPRLAVFRSSMFGVLRKP
jgi:SAM-dependent methyltransferase